MKPHEILTTKEFFEPETVRTLFPQLDEMEIEQLQVLQALTYNLAFWQDLFVFENAVLALNGIKPELGFMQGCTPQQIWYAVQLVSKAFPEREYDYEIKQYIKFISNQQGVYVYPPEVFDISENPYYEKAKLLALSDQSLDDKTSISIQAAHLAAILIYMRIKQDDEKLKLNQETKKEAYYAPTSVELEKDSGGGVDQVSSITPTSTPVIPLDIFDNYSAAFNGTQTYVLSGISTDVLKPSSTTPYSLSLWTYLPSSTNPTGDYWLIDRGAAGKRDFGINVDAAGFVLYLGTSTVTLDRILIGFNLDAWNHIVWCISSSGYFEFWNNGIKGYSWTISLSPPTGGKTVIGGVSPGGGSAVNRYSGYINDITFWNNTFLTSGQIQTIYTNKSVDISSGLGLPAINEYYRFGDSKDDTSSCVIDYLGGTKQFIGSTQFVKFTQNS
jgi:hypothetical protein